MTRPLILVSNDDGIIAPGISALAEVAAEFGDVVVSAPDGERSAMSHAITLRANLRSQETHLNWHAVSGTPVDSVYLGALHLCPRLPDLVVSGINAGYNLGTDVFYSGTVGAAREGLLRGCSALAISVQAGGDPKIAQPAARILIPMLLERHAAGEHHLLNVNVPRIAEGVDPVPLQACRLGRRIYQDQVMEREDLQGRPYFWIGGPPAEEKGGQGDIAAVNDGKISVTPLELDITAPELPLWRELIEKPEST